MVLIRSSRGTLKLIRRRPYLKTSVRSSKKAVVVLGIVFTSAICGSGGYGFSEETSVAEQAGKEMSVRGKVIKEGIEKREGGHYYYTLRLQTMDGERVAVRASANKVLCGTLGVIDAIRRAKKDEEVVVFGKQAETNTIDLCGSAGYYLKNMTRDETTNWVAYRSEKYGFEVKHPTSWTVREDSGFVGFRDARWNQQRIRGHAMTINLYRRMPREQAIREAGFQTAKEAMVHGDLSSGYAEEGKYYTHGGAAGNAAQAVETTINGLPALYAEHPVRLYGEEEGHIGASTGEIVFLFGDGIYASITSWGPVDVFDLIVSTFKFIGK